MKAREIHERVVQEMDEKVLAIVLYLPMLVFGCLAVVEECTFDLIDTLRGDVERA